MAFVLDEVLLLMEYEIYCKQHNRLLIGATYSSFEVIQSILSSIFLLQSVDGKLLPDWAKGECLEIVELIED
jgi:hypothetical protein